MQHVINNRLLNRSLLFCRFSMAAYQSGDPRLTPGLQTGQLTLDTRLPLGFAANETDTQVLVCRWNNDVVVAFRGTELKLQDMLTDLRASLVPCTGGPGQVHHGFQSALNSVYPQIVRAISQITIAGTSRLYVCGHSLGGALSMLFAGRYVRERAFDGQRQPSLAEVFTYGAPRVGDADFASNYRKSPAGSVTFCWVANQDPVTRVAPASLRYRHAVPRQLCVDNAGWVRHTDIDGIVVAEAAEQTLLQQVMDLLQHASIAASLEASSHKLEQSYLQQLLIAVRKSRGQ